MRTTDWRATRRWKDGAWEHVPDIATATEEVHVSAYYIGEPMTVGRLIEELRHLPKDRPVVFAVDEEGNRWHNAFQVQDDGDMVSLWPSLGSGTDSAQDAIAQANAWWKVSAKTTQTV
jgi:hypothetical protein